MNFLTNVNLNKNEIQNAVVQVLAAAPSSPVEGQIYYSSVDHIMYQYNGTSWVPVGYSGTLDAMIFKGTIGSSGATVSSLPATHSAGWTYKVITAGTYAGQTCEVGDLIICVADGTVAADADWTVVQTNIDGAVTGPASSTSGHIPTFNGTSGKVIQDGYGVVTTISDTDSSIPTAGAVYDAIAGVSGGVSVATGTIGTSATSATVSYSGTLVAAYAKMSDAVVMVDIAFGTGSVTFSVASAPSAAITCVVAYTA